MEAPPIVVAQPAFTRFDNIHHTFSLPYVEGVTDLHKIKNTILSKEPKRVSKVAHEIDIILVGRLRPLETPPTVQVYIRFKKKVAVHTRGHYDPFFDGPVTDLRSGAKDFKRFLAVHAKGRGQDFVAHGHNFRDFGMETGATTGSILGKRKKITPKLRDMAAFTRELRDNTRALEEMLDDDDDCGFANIHYTTLRRTEERYQRRRDLEFRSDKTGLLIYKIPTGEGYLHEKTFKWENTITKDFGDEGYAEELALINHKTLTVFRIPIGLNLSIRTPHIWIWGDTNKGKSHFWLDPEEGFSVDDPERKARSPYGGEPQPLPGFHIYSCDSEEGWLKDYTDSAHIVVMNELTEGRMKPPQLKAFLEGIPLTKLPAKHSHVEKKANHPCIIITQHHPRVIYEKMKQEDYDALMSRVYVVYQQYEADFEWIPKPITELERRIKMEVLPRTFEGKVPPEKNVPDVVTLPPEGWRPHTPPTLRKMRAKKRQKTCAVVLEENTPQEDPLVAEIREEQEKARQQEAHPAQVYPILA